MCFQFQKIDQSEDLFPCECGELHLLPVRSGGAERRGGAVQGVRHLGALKSFSVGNRRHRHQWPRGFDWAGSVWGYKALKVAHACEEREEKKRALCCDQDIEL